MERGAFIQSAISTNFAENRLPNACSRRPRFGASCRCQLYKAQTVEAKFLTFITMLDISPSFLDIAAALGALISFFTWYASRSKTAKGRLALAPSPRGWPLIGNLLDMPTFDGWKAFHQLCEKLDTSILYLNIAGQHAIVLDTYEDCVELLEKRSSLYSGRTSMTMVTELMGWDFNLATMQYGSKWRDCRRIMHDSFHPNAAKAYRPVQMKSVRKLLPKLTTNTNIVRELRQMAGETIISIAYGLDAKPKNDPHIQAAEKAVDAVLQAAVPGAFLVDSLPILKYVPAWMPGASFKRKAREWRIDAMRMLHDPFNACLDAMKEGVAKPSFVQNGMQTAETKGGIYNEENVRSVAGTLFQTGADTTVSAVGFCILSLLDQPDYMRKIQEEIDLVTDSSRLPSFEDEESFPYLMAFVKESMRYWSVVPLAVPHYLDVEDQYKGYRIPAKSMIVANTWAILHNEEVFLDPFTMNPERFLFGDNVKVVNAHYNCAWGYGRRACPGRYLAFASIWITLAHILAVYDISKAKDEEGNDIELCHEPVTSSILLMPQEYLCSFTPRSSAARQLVALAGEVEL